MYVCIGCGWHSAVDVSDSGCVVWWDIRGLRQHHGVRLSGFSQDRNGHSRLGHHPIPFFLFSYSVMSCHVSTRTKKLVLWRCPWWKFQWVCTYLIHTITHNTYIHTFLDTRSIIKWPAITISWIRWALSLSTVKVCMYVCGSILANALIVFCMYVWMYLAGQVKVNQDIKGQYADGDYPLTQVCYCVCMYVCMYVLVFNGVNDCVCMCSQGLIHAGALVYLTNSLRSKKSPLDASYTTSTPKGRSGYTTVGGWVSGWYIWIYSYKHSIVRMHACMYVKV